MILLQQCCNNQMVGENSAILKKHESRDLSCFVSTIQAAAVDIMVWGYLFGTFWVP